MPIPVVGQGRTPYRVIGSDRRDVAEVGERAARWLASENLTSGPGWSALHDLIFEEALIEATAPKKIRASSSGSDGLTE